MRREDRKWAGEFFREFHHSPRAGEFDRWLAYVNQIHVQMHLGGRAILTHPDADLRVEIRWDETGFTSFLIEAEPGGSLPSVEVSMSPFLAALELKKLHVVKGRDVTIYAPTVTARASVPTPTVETIDAPHSGRSPSLAHYRRVLDDYDALVGEGSRSPVNELARRYRVRPGTVKSWLSRGRNYLKEER